MRRLKYVVRGGKKTVQFIDSTGMAQVISSHPPLLVADILGGILPHLVHSSDHLALRLTCSSLARDVCSESRLLHFHLRTMDQLETLKQSPFVGEERIRHVVVVWTSSQQDAIVKALSHYVTKLKCRYCKQLTNGCFDSLVHLTQLDCSGCFHLTNGCFDMLTNLTQLDCTHCEQLTVGCFDALTNLSQLSCTCCHQLTVGCFDTLTNLTQLACKGCIELITGCFDTLTNLTQLDCDYCHMLSNGCFDKLVHLPKLSYSYASRLNSLPPEHIRLPPGVRIS